MGDLLKVRLGKCCFKERLRLRTKNKKIFNPVTRYFDLMDSLKMYPIRGGGADPIIVFYHEADEEISTLGVKTFQKRLFMWPLCLTWTPTS